MGLPDEFIKVNKSGIHNNGVFARMSIPKGTRIIEYVGERISKKESDRRSEATLERSKRDTTSGAVYIFELNKRYDIDGDVPHNTAKYINHSCLPNCEIEKVRGHIWIVASRDIDEGEELSYNYGYDMEDYQEHPCRCGAPNCVGYILDEDHWPKVRQWLEQKVVVSVPAEPQSSS
ncbi:MAG: SET domain-containing protein-lysine N-methyltransferase [Nanoarchaeota archaeon]